jgi:hypothetical protein
MKTLPLVLALSGLASSAWGLVAAWLQRRKTMASVTISDSTGRQVFISSTAGDEAQLERLIIEALLERRPDIPDTEVESSDERG